MVKRRGASKPLINRLKERINSGARRLSTGFFVPARDGDAHAGAEGALGERLRDIRSPHRALAAGIVGDLLTRHLPTAQAAITTLPALLRYDDPDLLRIFHAILVAALFRERDAGPQLARAIPPLLEGLDPDKRRPALARLLRAADVDWRLAVVVAESLPALVRDLDDAALDRFIHQAFVLWRDNREKAVSFLKRESRRGQLQVEMLRHALSLNEVRRTLQLYAQAHAGPHVHVVGIDHLPEDVGAGDRSRARTDGRRIFLPLEVDGFETAEENFRLFKAMTAIEACRIEFGTFSLGAPAGDGDEGDGPSASPARALRSRIHGLAYPALAERIFSLLETHRIESRVRLEYPGIHSDLERLTHDEIARRPHPAELDPLDAVLEMVLRRLWTPEARFADPRPHLTDYADALLLLTEPLSEAASRVEDSIARTADAIEILRPLLEAEGMREADGGSELPQENAADAGNEAERSARRRASSPDSSSAGAKSSSGTGRSNRMEPLAHQGRLDLEFAARMEEEALSAERGDEGEAGRETRVGESAVDPGGGADIPPGEGAESAARLFPGQPPPMGGHRRDPEGEPSSVVATHAYPEWDWQIEDYKDNWCRVVEERLPESSSPFAEDVLLAYGPIVNRLKRQFQRMRREAYERLFRQPEGDEIDLEAAVEAMIDHQSGHPPSDRLYVQRLKRQRDVAVAFLVDMSSSTQQPVNAGGKTILDIEKESLLLMAEALESLGDAYAIYGFSGYGRRKVSFYVAKEFDESYGPSVRRRIGGLSGKLENRDGAGIRHATSKLMAHPAKVRLLIVLSDGRPLDCGCRQYFERYAQEDTRKALEEARRRRIHPFCITVDRQAQRYLGQMYRQVQYTIIDRVTALPERLPLIYRRLTT